MAVRLVAELGRAKDQKDEPQAKVVLVELYDLLVSSNAKLDPVSPERTMSDADLKWVLARLRPLARQDSKEKLVLPSQLKNTNDLKSFVDLFVPFSS